MPALLPAISSADEFEPLRGDEAVWRPAVEAIAQRHGLGGPCRLFPTGSAVVFAVGARHVIKLHEPWHPDLYQNEARWLAWLDGRLPVASPGLIAAGDLEGWGYLVMRRLPGRPLSEVRDAIPARDRLHIAAEIGALAARIQALPVPASIVPQPPWAEFSARQRRRCRAHHQDAELPPHLLAGLEDQLAGVDLDVDPPVPLHTELTDTNLTVERRAGRWRLSGVFDFEPSMLGHPLYDLPAITIFVAQGDPALCRAALAGYGRDTLDGALRRQLLACTLLHRYSHLGFFLRQVGVETYPCDWDAVARHLYGF